MLFVSVLSTYANDKCISRQCLFSQEQEKSFYLGNNVLVGFLYNLHLNNSVHSYTSYLSNSMLPMWLIILYADSFIIFNL